MEQKLKTMPGWTEEYEDMRMMLRTLKQEQQDYQHKAESNTEPDDFVAQFP